MADEEIPLYGGLVDARVVRVGDTVRRPAGAWTATNQALLAHLQRKNFPSPKPLGLDEQGREIVSYLPGRTAPHPWPAQLRATSGAREIGVLLRAFHDAVADFTPPAPAIWRHGPQDLAPGEIVLHGDFGPWNLLWHEGRLSGVIDFELARPGRPLEDAVFCVLRVALLRPDEKMRVLGFKSPPDRRARLKAFGEGYGCAPEELLAAACAVQAGELTRMVRFGGAGMEPWVTFLARGLKAEAESELRWLEDHVPALLASLA